MPKAKVSTTYQRAASSPSERATKSDEIRQRPRKKRKDLHAYVRDNEDTGIPYHELIKQYQEYECDHPTKQQEIISTLSTTNTFRCNGCGVLYTKPKPGAKDA